MHRRGLRIGVRNQSVPQRSPRPLASRAVVRTRRSGCGRRRAAAHGASGSSWRADRHWPYESTVPPARGRSQWSATGDSIVNREGGVTGPIERDHRFSQRLCLGPADARHPGRDGLLLTLGLVFMPWRKVGYGFRLLFEKGGATGEGEVQPFNALMTALSATVGTGNIAGVATAIALGGPGAIFYMWLIALFGMATKYAEAVCAVTYREKDKSGKYVGGRCTTFATASASSPPSSASGLGSRLRYSARWRRSASGTRCRSTRWRSRWIRASGFRPG